MSPIQTTIIDNLAIRYAASISGFAESILLLNPLPESIWAFEPIWDKLAEKFNVIAIDLPGFGRSQIREALLSPVVMAGFVKKAIDHFDLGPMHIVGPDVGSSVAMFVGQYHPDRIKSAVVGSAACVLPICSDGILTGMILDPDMDTLKSYGSKAIINGALANMTSYQLSHDVREDYLVSYEDGRFWDTMKFLKSLPAGLSKLDMDNLRLPVLIIWGETDPLAILKNGEILHERLPNNEFHVLPSGHYAWEDTHESYAELITEWVSNGYKRDHTY
ncbi:alpha/beta hydrolase [Mucilaginibacter gynuensis]|uniref:Alpha/beta hydrolase n=1 Tax=Mucilaginibacter gynuensis TaxID=1302236 RepID=A0ABP8G629_9SPHI